MKDRKAAAGMGLRYEPGGWGDILKGIWAAEIAAHLAAALPDGVVLGDPFAGAPDYPLLPETSTRLAAATGTGYAEAVARAGAARLPSTAVAMLIAAGGHGRARVFDADPVRRDAWMHRPDADVLAVEDGQDAILIPGILDQVDLLLIDPYDLHRAEVWERVLPSLARLSAGGAHILLYLHHEQRRPRDLSGYRKLRDGMADGIGPPLVVGRVPADRLLPRSWHEVLLYPALGIPRAALDPDLGHRLADATRRLAWAILDPGLVEGPEA